MPRDTTTSAPTPPPTSSTPPDVALAYYKAQYEQLESELADFQMSSRDLEAELEKDIEQSEKRERQLKTRVEAAEYEIDEWKTKYKKSKSEASTAQTTLQKEVSSLRDGNRQLQLKLRHIEVANDDFERQARYTTSSLEDMESKYNQAIERGVLLEEEIRSGEGEREKLRIDNQRLRDQYADLQVETQILQDKLKKAEFSAKARARKASLAGERIPRMPKIPSSPTPSANSNSTPTSSPTKPFRLRSDSASTPLPPPSPTPEMPLFQPPMVNPALARAPRKPGGGSLRASSGPSFQRQAIRPNQRHSRSATHQPTRAPSARTTQMLGMRSNMFNPSANGGGVAAASGTEVNDNQRPGSLFQIKGLIGKMQKLEERVNTARSRLPAPSETSSRRSVVSPEAPSPSSILQTATSGVSAIHRASLSQHKPPPRSAYASDSRPSSRTSRGSRASLSGRSSATSFNHSHSSLGHYDDKTTASSTTTTATTPSKTTAMGSATASWKITPPRTKMAVPPRSIYSQSSSTTTSSSSPPPPTAAASGIPTPKKFGLARTTTTSPSPPPQPDRDLGETY